MAKTFITDDFLLTNEPARRLYHDYAAFMPIYDYHCHLPPAQIAEDKCYDNLTQVWLYGDHYKWRAMRTNGVDERFITGAASDEEKFEHWAKTVPATVRNPLYHWTHLELLRYFGVDELLDDGSAKRVYDACNEKLRSPEYSVRGLMCMMNVKLVCTTDDPLDDLKEHQKIADSGFAVKVYPAWRPDKAMAVENLDALNAWIDRLAQLTNIDINSFSAYIEAIRKRHDFFHSRGCRLSDHGLETAYAEDYTANDTDAAFADIRAKKTLSASLALKFKSAMLHELALMDGEKDWTQQFHFGAQRNNNTRMFKLLGPDTGYDSIGDFEISRPLAKLLDRLDQTNQLPRTVLYNLNPRDNTLMATMLGNFQDGVTPGKLQWGSGWWFLDQKHGMIDHLNTLSVLGLLSRFVGMLTDSRSFLSYPRHEYFRRILCNLIGADIANGELPADYKLLGQIVQDICYNNALAYFRMPVD
ncbi:MAG: glucuronate isomerase [Sedimentisphaerales bacterium]|nr:glucuronate isomerase [Sedimentisphaerales bacterium]